MVYGFILDKRSFENAGNPCDLMLLLMVIGNRDESQRPPESEGTGSHMGGGIEVERKNEGAETISTQFIHII